MGDEEVEGKEEEGEEQRSVRQLCLMYTKNPCHNQPYLYRRPCWKLVPSPCEKTSMITTVGVSVA